MYCRLSAAVWAHKWKWDQINDKEEAEGAARQRRRKSGGSSILSSLHLPLSLPLPLPLPLPLSGTDTGTDTSSDTHKDRLLHHIPSNSKNKFFTGAAAVVSRQPSSSIGDFFSKSRSALVDVVDEFSHSIDRSADRSDHSFNHSYPHMMYNHTRLCVLYDDDTDIFVAEISEDQWQSFSEVHDFRMMEATGADPMLESYLVDSLDSHHRSRDDLPDLTLSAIASDSHQKVSSEELKLLGQIEQLKEEVCSADQLRTYAPFDHLIYFLCHVTHTMIIVNLLSCCFIHRLQCLSARNHIMELLLMNLRERRRQ